MKKLTGLLLLLAIFCLLVPAQDRARRAPIAAGSVSDSGAISSAADGNALTLTSSLPTTTNLTCGGWVRYTSIQSFGGPFSYTGVGSNFITFAFNGGSDGMHFYNRPVVANDDVVFITHMAASTWTYFGFSKSGVTMTSYVGTTAGDLSSVNTIVYTGDPSMTELRFNSTGGAFGGDDWIGQMAAWKCWQSALTEAELETESTKYAAVITSNLYGQWKMNVGASAGADSSGNSHTLTITGTFTDTTGPSGVD